jgi:hypothetical protein
MASGRDRVTGKDKAGDTPLGKRERDAIQAENAKPFGISQAPNEITKRAKQGGHPVKRPNERYRDGSGFGRKRGR